MKQVLKRVNGINLTKIKLYKHKIAVFVQTYALTKLADILFLIFQIYYVFITARIYISMDFIALNFTDAKLGQL